MRLCIDGFILPLILLHSSRVFVVRSFSHVVCVVICKLSLCTQINCVIERHCDESKSRIFIMNKLRFFTLFTHTALRVLTPIWFLFLLEKFLANFDLYLCNYLLRVQILNPEIGVLNFCICLFIIPAWKHTIKTPID